MAELESIIVEALARYRREYDRYLKLTARVADICRSEVVEAHAIRAQVTSRTKSLRSLALKLRRFAREEPDAVSSVERVFEEIHDFAAVRIVTFDAADEPKVVQALIERFDGNRTPDVIPDRKDKHSTGLESFYRATHCDVYLKPEELVGTYANLTSTACEIQVCSMMSHVWNEVEHDLRYKAVKDPLSAAEKSLLEQLGKLCRTGDAIVGELLVSATARQRELTGAFQDVYDFLARIGPWFPAVELGKYAGLLFDELTRLGIHTPQQLEALVGDPGDVAVRSAELLVEFARRLQAAGHRRHALERASSDLLLVALLPALAARIVDEPAGSSERENTSRTAWFAARYLELKS